VTGGQQDTASSLADADEVASSGSAENAILAHQELLDTVGGTDLSDLGDHLGVVVTAITTNDEEGPLNTLGNGEENTSDEGLGVVGLLEDLDLLAKAGAGRRSARFNCGTASHIRSRLLVSERLNRDRLDGHDEMNWREK
jgi:hypothetical protein